MTRHTVEHRFVEFIPDDLVEGIVYVSITYATVVHRCCCGCGSEVVTPLAPNRWAVTFDGESISLTPSIGNWSFPCQSHYWIAGNHIEWARRWSCEEIEAGRSIDHTAMQPKALGNVVSESRPRREQRRTWQRVMAAIFRRDR